jgi:hypothetical protein
MSLPAGIATVTLTIGPGVDFAGNALPAGRVTFKPSANVTWQADGTPLFASEMTVELDENGTGQIVLPATDQNGFINGSGSTIKNWTYLVTWKFADPTIIPPAPFNIQLPAAVAEADLDLLIPTSGSAGVVVSMPAVLSVNGQTGNVTVSGGSGSFSGASSDVTYDHTISGLVATNVKTALDELAADILGILPPPGTTNGKVATVQSGAVVWSTPASGGGGTGAASGTTFTPGSSGLTSSNVQDAIVELMGIIASEKTSWLADARVGMVLSANLGVANGVATLGSDGKLTAAQAPAGSGGGGVTFPGGVQGLDTVAPGTSFNITFDGTNWKYAGATITTRPSSRTDITMVCRNPVNNTVPSFAIDGDILRLETTS